MTRAVGRCSRSKRPGSSSSDHAEVDFRGPSLVVAVADAMNGKDNRRVLGIGFDALAQLGDVLVESAAVGHVIQAPAFVEKIVARNNHALVFVEQFEDFDVAKT